MKSKFEEMLQNGTARHSDSPWASPLHLVPKKEDGWRPCGDYLSLNARTIPDQYPVRHIADFAQQLSGRKIFSMIDFVKAYHQIPVRPDNIAKTAIITPFGLFKFPYMSFGLRNAAQTLQRFISEVLRDLDFCYAYIDDVLVTSTLEEEHEQHLHTLFQHFNDYGVLLNPAKCVFGATEVTFLGYTVSAAGTRPLEEKIAAINHFQQPVLVKDLRRFLGMLNFYHRFILQATSIQAPLHAAFAAPKVRGSHPVDWTPTMVKAFKDCKSSLSRGTLLAHPAPSATFALFTDTSDIAIGTTLQQHVCDAWQPMAFNSHKLSPAQQKYSPYNHELLAVYEAIKYFQHMVEGRHFVIFTNHKPLTYAFQQWRNKCSPHQFRHLELIGQFFTDFRHVSGQDSVVADALTKANSVTTPLDYHALASSQDQDAELHDILKHGSALRLEQVHIPGMDIFICCDTSTRQPQPFITTPFRCQVFDTLHSLSRPEANTTVKLVSQRFLWPGVGKDCHAWTRACTPCQRSKITRHVKAPLRSFNLPSACFFRAYQPGRAVACLFQLLVLSHCHQQIHISLPSTDTHVGLRHSLCLTLLLKKLQRPSSLSGLLISAAPSKSQLTRASSSRPDFSRLWLPSPDPL